MIMNLCIYMAKNSNSHSLVHRRRSQNPPESTSEPATNSVRNHIPPPNALLLRLPTAYTTKTVDASSHIPRSILRSRTSRAASLIPTLSRRTTTTTSKRKSIPTKRPRRTPRKIKHTNRCILLASPTAHLPTFLAQQHLRLFVRQDKVAGQARRSDFAAIGAVVEFFLFLRLRELQSGHFLFAAAPGREDVCES